LADDRAIQKTLVLLVRNFHSTNHWIWLIIEISSLLNINGLRRVLFLLVSISIVRWSFYWWISRFCRCIDFGLRWNWMLIGLSFCNH
jgi:hypothetical protein